MMTIESKIEVLSGILAQNPGDAFARYGLAMEYKLGGENASALGQFEELRNRRPEYTPGYQMAAQILLAEGRTGEAKEWLQAGIESAQAGGNRHAISEMEAMLEELLDSEE